jgi:hypothetical protein
MRKGFLICEEMRKYLVIYETVRALVIYDFATAPFWISLYMRIFFLLFYQCTVIGIWENSRKVVEERLLDPFSFSYYF